MSVPRSRQSPTPVKMPRPFSVNIFKPPTMASSQGPVNSKFGAPPQGGNHMGWLPSWSLFNSHLTAQKLPGARSYPLFSTANTPGEGHLIPQNFFIYPSAQTGGTYIYQPSISNKSEVFSPSDYDSSSSASYTPSTFSPALSSTDSILTTSSSSPNHPPPSSLPSSSIPDTAYPSQVIKNGFSASQVAVHSDPVARHSGYRASQRIHAGEATPPMPDDHRTILNTELNARTAHYTPFRSTSANMSQHDALSISSNPSDIILHPASSSGRYEAFSRSSPSHVENLPAEPSNRLPLIPLPPIAEVGLRRDSPPPRQLSVQSIPSRRDSSFMPYYFPDSLAAPQQYTSQTAGGNTLPFPPGLAFPEVPMQMSPDELSASEMRADTPSNVSVISGQDFSGFRILTYNESMDGSTLHGGSDVGLANVAPRDGHAPTMPEPRPRSYASVAARPGPTLSSSLSTLSSNQQGFSSFPQNQSVPPVPIPNPARQPSNSVHYSTSVPPIPVPQCQPPRYASTDSVGSRQSPVNGEMSSGFSRQHREWQPPNARQLPSRSSSTPSPPVGPGTVGGRIRRDSISAAHMRLDLHPHVPNVLPLQTPSTSVKDILQHPMEDYPPLVTISTAATRQSQRAESPPKRLPSTRRHSVDSASLGEQGHNGGKSPVRRHSDGDQVPLRATANYPTPRTLSVRWNENLICASPIFPEQRRRGWFNKRGDQLWTNTGTYKTPEPGSEYPLDLIDYPEQGEGWMNEHGVRIDLNHRLIPKVPLRPALKRQI